LNYHKWFSYFLIVVLLAGLAASVHLAIQRSKLEQNNRHVEVALESQEVEKLARYSGGNVPDVLAQLKSTGASGILFKELVISDLEPHMAWVVSGSQLLSGLYGEKFGSNLQDIQKEYNYIVSTDSAVHKQVAANLSAKILGTHVPEVSGEGLYLVGVPLTRGELSSIGLGFDEGLMSLAASQGFNLLVQIRNWPQSSPAGIREVFRLLEPYKGKISTVLFNDFMLPGFPEYLHIVNAEIENLGASFAFIETFIFKQQGAAQLGLEEPRNVVRLHSIGLNEMANMTPDRALDRLVLAVTDRNVRALLTRMFFPMDTDNWLEGNLRFLAGGNGFSGLVPSLEKEGFVVGKANPFPLHVTSAEAAGILPFIVGLGAISGGIVLLGYVGMPRLGLILGGLGLLGWAAVFFAASLTGIGLKLMALASVVIFPTLAIVVMLREKGCTSIGQAVLRLLIASGISLIGAVLMVGLLANLNFMLKLDQFVGVKAAHVMPIVLLLFFFYFWRDRQDWHLRIKSLMDTAVTNKYLLITGFLAVAVLIYVARTGNEGAAISTLELKVRSLLDQYLLVRPRTKEFLVGHPFMLLAFYLGYRHEYIPLLVLGSIGQISMVNTFAHVHTPLVVSLLRTFNGLWLGIILGVILILLWKGYKSLESRLFNG